MIVYVEMIPDILGVTDNPPPSERTRVYESVTGFKLDEGFVIMTFEDGTTIGIRSERVEEWSFVDNTS